VNIKGKIVDLIYLPCDRDEWWAVMNTVLNLGLHKGGEGFLV
jgi:hypothetical protein